MAKNNKGMSCSTGKVTPARVSWGPIFTAITLNVTL